MVDHGFMAKVEINCKKCEFDCEGGFAFFCLSGFPAFAKIQQPVGAFLKETV